MPTKLSSFSIFSVTFCFLVVAPYLLCSDQPTIVTVAGSGLPVAIPATEVGVGDGRDISVDFLGNLFIADATNHVVYKVTPAGNISVFAGSGTPNPPLDIGLNMDWPGNPGHVGDGGQAINAKFSDISNVVADGMGNIYIADTNSIIRKVDLTGKITTVAGTGVPGLSGDGGQATQAEIYLYSFTADESGNLYFPNPTRDGACVIRKVNTSGVINTIAGNGRCGFTGDGGLATNAEINAYYIASDGAGNIYFSDADTRIRKVSGGVINTIAGTGTCGLSGDGGQASNAQICVGYVTTDASRNIFFEQYQDGYSYVREIFANGVITTVAGNGIAGYQGDGGPALNAEIIASSLAADSFGNLFINDSWFNGARVRRVNNLAIINAFAGNGTTGFAGDNNLATNAKIDGPSGIATDSRGTFYVGDWNDLRVRSVNSTGTITTVAGTGNICFEDDSCGDGGLAIDAPIGNPAGMVLDANGNLYFAEGFYGCCVRMVDTHGFIHRVAGGGNGDLGDGGPATQATLSWPAGLVFDNHGNLYISDYWHYRIRQVDTDAFIHTVAGNGTRGYSGDGGLATNAELSDPSGVLFDSAGNMYIGDGTRVRKVDTNGIISTVAGNGIAGYSGDGGPATEAELNFVDGLAVDASDNLYIADGNERIRRVDHNGVITTFAGTGIAGFSGDGGLAIDAQFSHPGALAFDSDGNLLVGDVFNYRVRKIILPLGPVVNLSPSALDFGPQGTQRMNVPQTSTLTNTGGGALLITNIAIGGTNPADFSIEGDDCPMSPNSLAPGAHCHITVIFSPIGVGTRNANVTITDNAVDSPQMIALTGIGVGGKVALR